MKSTVWFAPLLLTSLLGASLLGSSALGGCAASPAARTTQVAVPTDSEQRKQAAAEAAREAERLDAAERASFVYEVDRFADTQVLRYRVPGFDGLSLRDKKLLYFLSEAAVFGRDMAYDQNHANNLLIRRALEVIWTSFPGDRSTDDYQRFENYTKRVWFSNGIHHHYSSRKMLPEFSQQWFRSALKASLKAGKLETVPGSKEGIDSLWGSLIPAIFDPKVGEMRTNHKPGVDLVKTSANNFYSGLTEAEVKAFYDQLRDPKDDRPVMWGLNSQLAKGKDGKIVERTWKLGGMYDGSIRPIVSHLEAALEVTEGEAQRGALERLVAYYKSGSLKDFDAYNVAWVNDKDSRVDVVNGFIETYADPLDMRGSFESVVSIRDMEATKRIATVAASAQWFEDQSPIAAAHKKANVVGISAKAILVVQESGDAAPATPIGINLPNSDWIRKEHGSKSVTISNVVEAYEESGKNGGALEEFAFSPEEMERQKKYGTLAHLLKVDMHEVIGHGSGQLEAGVATPSETLKNYGSTLEEGRADLVALYYVMDPKLVELGLMPNLDVGRAAYDAYIRNGLLQQMWRIPLGEDIQEAHMRNRQFIAKWAFEKGQNDKVIERVERDGKTFFVIRDYEKLRALFGELLREVQRIKSQGDFAAGKALVESYGVKLDRALHAEVIGRYTKLNRAAFSGFVQPKLSALLKDGSVAKTGQLPKADDIVDVKLTTTEGFAEQMLRYARDYTTLLSKN